VALIGEGRYLDVKREYHTTLGQALKLYRKNFGRQPSYNSAKAYFVKRYKTYFGEDRRLADIRYRDLESYRSYLKQTLTAKKTIRTDAATNREMSCLRHIFNKAIEWELIDESPFTKGQSLFIKENNQRLRYLTEEEITALLKACSTKVIKFPDSKTHVKQMTRKDVHYLRDIVGCALLTGMRKGEILGLKWRQVKGNFIYLRKTKTAKSRQVPISDDLAALFKRIRQRQGLGSEYVFTFEGKRIESLKGGFAAAVERAGIEDLKFHDCRHTFSSHFVMRGGSIKALQEILGHTTLTMTMKYAHLAQSHKKQAVNLLNGLTAPRTDNRKPDTVSII